MNKISKTQIVQEMIKDMDMSIPDFCRKVSIPYTTILGIFKSDLESASITNITKICDGLGVTYDKIREMAGEIQSTSTPNESNHYTDEELQIARYISDDDELRDLFTIIKNATPNDQRLYIGLIKRLDAGK